MIDCKMERSTYWMNVLIFGYCWECGMGMEKRKEVEGYGESFDAPCVQEGEKVNQN